MTREDRDPVLLAAEPLRPLRWGRAERGVVERALAGTPADDGWRVGHLAPESLTLEGDAGARRLCLWVTVHLVAPEDQQQARLRLRLNGDAWAQRDPFPPAARTVALETVVSADPDALLTYAITEAGCEPAVQGSTSPWIHYLASPAAFCPEGGEPGVLLADQLAGVLSQWLSRELAVETVGGAVEMALAGPVGHFGPVERRLLDRSGQVDLAVDATPLGEAGYGPGEGGDRGIHLALYGERHGLWLLHRRTFGAAGKRAKGTAARPVNSEVLVARSADALMAAAGLGEVEKRLFQDTGLLRPETLWATSGEKDAENEGTAAGATVDLETLPERQRRHLHAIFLLAEQGHLSTTDTDLLLKTARHIARPSARSRR